MTVLNGATAHHLFVCKKKLTRDKDIHKSKIDSWLMFKRVRTEEIEQKGVATGGGVC